MEEASHHKALSIANCRWMKDNLHISAEICHRAERTNKVIQYRFIITLLKKAACGRNMDIVLHPTA